MWDYKQIVKWAQTRFNFGIRVRVTTKLMQLFFDSMGQRGFGRARKAGEPDDGAAMAVLRLAARTGDGGVVPNDITHDR